MVFDVEGDRDVVSDVIDDDDGARRVDLSSR